LAGVLKLMNHLSLNFPIFFGLQWIADTESVDTGAHLYLQAFIYDVYILHVIQKIYWKLLLHVV
jgi:hypothetical protein